MSYHPLKGVRIIDLTRHLPGPLATLILSDLGAEVIKVESPFQGDPVRYIPPIISGSSLLFHALNRGKHFVSIDLRKERDIFLSLLSTADCMVESFKPDALVKLDLDPNLLVTRFPNLIIVRMSGYGMKGPSKPGHDINFMALSGSLGITRNLSPLPVQVADCGASLLAVIHILSSLITMKDRELPPDQRILDCPIIDAGLLFSMPLYCRALSKEDISEGKGLLEGGFSLYRIYNTRDGRKVAIGAIEQEFHRKIEDCFGAIDEKTLECRFHELDIAQIMDMDLPCVEPVLNPLDVPMNPIVRNRGLFANMNTDEGSFLLPITPFTSKIPEKGPWAKSVGEDNLHFLGTLYKNDPKC